MYLLLGLPVGYPGAPNSHGRGPSRRSSRTSRPWMMGYCRRRDQRQPQAAACTHEQTAAPQQGGRNDVARCCVNCRTGCCGACIQSSYHLPPLPGAMHQPRPFTNPNSNCQTPRSPLWGAPTLARARSSTALCAAGLPWCVGSWVAACSPWAARAQPTSPNRSFRCSVADTALTA